MSSSLRALALPATLGTLALLAACAVDIPTPTSPVAVKGAGRVSVSAAGAANRHPNSEKYRDAGAKPATGRSGSASLEVRALLGKTGDVTLEASTGSIEAGTNPGNIAKTQVKILAGAGATKNYNNLSGGGYWTATYQGLARSDGIQVQANVRGIDPKRTDVVTVLASVMRRPDLAVMSVTGPSQAPPNTPVTFTAALAELNGDVGARANCVLSVDGTDVDHADGIWVDAGDAVSCLFTYAFAASGAHDVGVSLTNVTPGDWDTANNSAATSITIAQPGTPIQWGYVQAGEFNYGYWYRYYNNTGSSYRYDQTYNQRVDYSHVYAYGQDQDVQLTGLQRIDFAIDVDGVPFHSRSLTTPSWTYDYDDGNFWQHCWSFSDGGDYGDMCSYGYYGSYAYTYYQVQHISGTSTYYGNGYNCDQNNANCNTWSFNYDSVYGNGTQFSIGNSVRVQASFVDLLGTAHTVDRAVTDFQEILLPSGIIYSYCYPDSYRGGESCYEQSYGVGGKYRYNTAYWP
jgi:hypothetical protein